MRRFLMMFLMTGAAFAQTTQIYTGTIKDLTQQVVTSGQVTFTLTLPTASTIPGIGTFVPTTTLCNINVDGTLSGYVGGVVSGACIVTANISLTPTGTAYRICEQPNFSTPGSCFYDYALGGTKDISSVVPTLPTGPINYGGVPGPAATVAIGTVTTLPPGSSATATNSGNSSGAVINFGIPQGAVGSPTSGVNLTPPGNQTIVQPPGTSLNVNLACFGTDPINVKGCYGARGDLNATGGCSITSSSTTLTCTGGGFAGVDIGKDLYVQGAGAAGASLVTKVAGFTSSTVVTLVNAASTTVTAKSSAWGTDDTAAINAALSHQRAFNGAIYFPTGSYLHHGLNMTGIQAAKVYADARGSVSLYAIAVTNPGRINSTWTVGVDLSGSQYNEIDGLTFWGSLPYLADLAPQINVFGGRSGPAGGPAFAIAHIFDADFFSTNGPYNVVLYGYEQSDFRNCTFESTGNGNLGQLYMSANNTPGFVSPYVNVVAPTNSMTKVTVSGARTSFSANAGPMVMLDEGQSGSDYAIAIRDVYSLLAGSATFLADTGTASTFALRHIELDEVYIEGSGCTACRVANIGAPAWNWNINNVQFYTTGLTVASFNFANGFLDSNMLIDVSGNTTGITLNSPSCLGSVLHLGVQQPFASCTDYALATSFQGALPQAITGHFASSPGTGPTWLKLGTYVGQATGSGATIIFGTGAGINTNANQQNTAILTMRTGNNTTAPNLSGVTIANLESGNAILGVKAVATGGSTAIANLSWDIYIQIAAFSQSTYEVILPRFATWIPISTTTADPGAASSTLVVGNVITLANTSQIPIIGTPPTSSTVCTPPTVVFDASFIYTCVATNSWRRAASVTF